jgi:hypothetical protein
MVLRNRKSEASNCYRLSSAHYRNRILRDIASRRVPQKISRAAGGGARS